MKPLNSGNAVETLTPAGWWEMLFNYIQKKTSFFTLISSVLISVSVDSAVAIWLLHVSD